MAKKEMVKKETTDKKDTGNDPGVFAFGDELKEELQKVVWPSRQQLISESAAVILMVILVATTISLVDKFFFWGAAKVFIQ
jgi:preprotein translocase subunit SecE